jgi:hypothetical protein
MKGDTMRTLATVALVLVSTPVLAADPMSWDEHEEGRVTGIATWATGLAIGDSYDFAPKYGFLGFNGEVMYWARSDLSIGISSGYQLFHGKERDTVHIGDVALNSYQFRYLDTVPILAVGRYYVALGDAASFFPALGIGTIYTNREADLGLVDVHDDAWHFGVAPQVGLLFHTAGPDPLLDVKYTLAPGSPTEMWFTAEVGALFD